MKAAFDPHARKRASVYANKDFFCVMSCAGYRSTVMNQVVAFLERNISNEELGAAVLCALDSYQVIPVEKLDDYFLLERSAAKFADWESDVCTRAGYSSKRKLYAALRLVPVELVGTTLSFTGTVKRRGAAFEANGFSIEVDSEEGTAAVGEAVLAALEASV